jgi:menaquinone-9 beta-reductase
VRDVVVVGAGPAGSAAAHVLAQRGLDVLLVDRAEFPRDKTCGDGLTPRALRALDAIGALQDVQRHGCAIDAYEVVAPNHAATRASVAAHAVPRRVLDDVLRTRALASGAQFERAMVTTVRGEDGIVRVRTEQHKNIEARLAVVATGASTSVLLRSGILRQQPRAMLAARTYFDGLPLGAPVFQMRFDGVRLPGYGWIFPVGAGTANVGVGFMPGKRRGPTAQARLAGFVRAHPMLTQARPLEPVRGFPIRVDFLRAPTYAERTLLVGEAAGLVNPLTGEGIDYALESAQIAAETIARSLETGDFALAAYERALRARFEKIFRFSEIVRDWYCRPLLLNVLVPLANGRPALRQQLTDVVLGEREPAGYGPMTILGRLAIYLVRTRRR